jgi:hypothetical protein
MPNGRGARRGIRAGGHHRYGFLGEQRAGEGLKESAGEKYRGSDTTPSANATRKSIQAFILPAMPLAEALETMRLQRVAGRTDARTAVVPTRPCRAPTR